MSDDGRADARLAVALNDDTGTTQARTELLAALSQARVFAAISATAASEHTSATTGLRAESRAVMAVLLIETGDGARALPVFSDLAALQQWRPDARPVPLTGSQACAAALDERASALLLDPVVQPAGAAAVIEVEELTALAEGWMPVGGTALTARRGAPELTAPAVSVLPELRRALRRALRAEALVAARVLDGPDGMVLGVAPREPLDPAALAALAHRVVRRLGPALPTSGLDLVQVPSRGPGQDVLRRTRFRRAG